MIHVRGEGGSELDGRVRGIAGMASDVGRLSLFTSKANTSCGRCASHPFRSEQRSCVTRSIRAALDAHCEGHFGGQGEKERARKDSRPVAAPTLPRLGDVRARHQPGTGSCVDARASLTLMQAQRAADVAEQRTQAQVARQDFADARAHTPRSTRPGTIRQHWPRSSLPPTDRYAAAIPGSLDVSNRPPRRVDTPSHRVASGHRVRGRSAKPLDRRAEPPLATRRPIGPSVAQCCCAARGPQTDRDDRTANDGHAGVVGGVEEAMPGARPHQGRFMSGRGRERARWTSSGHR
jgi:hypothetical protein